MKLVKLLLALFLVCSVTAEAKVELKLAILAPQGSTWANSLEAVKKEIESKTAGQVTLKLYPGGRQGDEQEVLKKMGIGYLDGGGFSGIGLGEMVPSTRMLELPFMWQNYGEVEKVLANMTKFYGERFEKAGYQLLGWAEGGFVHLFTAEPVKTAADLKKQKMWTWSGDPLSDALFKGFGISPIPLALPNVLQSLQTGMINGAYGPPLLAIALQWHTKVKYMSEDHLTYSTAAVVLSKKAWDKLGNFQTTVREIVDANLKTLREQIRKDNEASKALMAKEGVQSVKLVDSEIQKIRTTSKKISEDLIGKLYSKEDLDALLKAKVGPIN